MDTNEEEMKKHIRVELEQIFYDVPVEGYEQTRICDFLVVLRKQLRIQSEAMLGLVIPGRGPLIDMNRTVADLLVDLGDADLRIEVSFAVVLPQSKPASKSAPGTPKNSALTSNVADPIIIGRANIEISGNHHNEIVALHSGFVLLPVAMLPSLRRSLDEHKTLRLAGHFTGFLVAIFVACIFPLADPNLAEPLKSMYIGGAFVSLFAASFLIGLELRMTRDSRRSLEPLIREMEEKEKVTHDIG